jgi:type IX secretion system substrate protein
MKSEFSESFLKNEIMKTHLNKNFKTGITQLTKAKAFLGIAFMMILVSGAFAQQSTSPEYTSQAAAEFRLPLVLTQFTVTVSNGKVKLHWSTGKEKQLSHFSVERSTNGIDFVEIGKVKAKGNSNVKINYDFVDQTLGSIKGVVCYRLKMVDLEFRFQNTNVEVVRISEANETVTVLTYPNPVTTELRVTLPESWQEKQVTIDLYNVNGQVVKRIVHGSAGQTEVVNVADISAGLYVMKVSNATETAVQRIVKKP